jgi:hypothetical protein
MSLILRRPTRACGGFRNQDLPQHLQLLVESSGRSALNLAGSTLRGTRNQALREDGHSAILAAVRKEFPKHTWETFVTEPPSIAQGGRGVLVPGCPLCRKIINTTPKFVDHLLYDVLPKSLATFGLTLRLRFSSGEMWTSEAPRATRPLIVLPVSLGRRRVKGVPPAECRRLRRNEVSRNV